MENKKEPLISVIIPVYNVEDYLDRCINSIINQDYKKIEIFLVDDGSTDNSGKICESYAENDNRIKVLHQKNAGQSAARNTALEIAQGDYYTFIDSDDYIDSDYVTFLLKLLQDNDAELSVCNVRHVGFPHQNDIEINNDIPYVCKGNDITTNILLGKNGFSASASHMLIKSNICKKIIFLEGVIFEDLEYMVQLSFLIKTAVSSQSRKYNYCYRPNNSSSTPTEKRKHDLDIVTKQIKGILAGKDIELSKNLENRYISNSLYLLRSLHKGEKKLFPKIRKDILLFNAEKEMLSKSDYALYKALKSGKFSYKIMEIIYNLYKKIKFMIKK